MPTTLLGSANAATGGQALPPISLIATEAAQAGRGGTGMVGVPAPIVGSKPITPIVNVADTVIPDFRTAQGTAAYQAYLQSDAAKAAGITPEYVAGVNSNVPSNVGSLSSQQIVTQTLQNIAKNPASTPASVANATATLTNMGAAVPPSPIVPSTITPIVTPNVPTPTVSAVLGFNPTGNVIRDLVSLKNSGASALTVASYLAMSGGWNWNVGTSPNSTPQEKELAQYLTSLGLSQDAFGGAYYTLDNPTTPNAQIRIPASIFNKATPSEQLALAKLTGLVPKDAVSVSMNPDGSLSYSLSSKMTSDYALTKPVLDQIMKDDPALYKNITSDINSLGHSATVIKYQDAINKAVGEVNAAQTTQPQTLDNWVAGLNANLLAIYNSKGGGAQGYKEVQTVQQLALAKLAPYMTSTIPVVNIEDILTSNKVPTLKEPIVSYNLNAALNAGVSRSTMIEAGFKAVDINNLGIKPDISFKPSITSQSSTLAQLMPSAIILAQSMIATRYLAAHPDGAQALKGMGYSQGIIDQAQKDAKNVSNSVSAINGFIGNSNIMSGQMLAVLDAIKKAGYYNPELVGSLKGQVEQQMSTKAQWDALTDDQKAEVAVLYGQDLYKGNPFSEMTKQEQDAATKLGKVGEIVAGMVLGIQSPIAKATTGQPVSSEEIRGAVVTGLVDTSMLIGVGEVGEVVSGVAKFIVSALNIGAAGVNLPSTIKTLTNPWASPLDVVLASGGEALLAGGGALGLKGTSNLNPLGKESIPIKAPSYEEALQSVVKGVQASRTSEELANITSIAESNIPKINPIIRTLADINNYLNAEVPSRDIPANIRAAVQSVINYMNETVPSRDVPANIKSAVQSVVNYMNTAVQSVVNYMNTEVPSRDIPANVRSAVQSVINNVKTTIQPVVDYMNAEVPSRDIPANVKAAVQSVVNYLNAEVPSRDIPANVKAAIQFTINDIKTIMQPIVYYMNETVPSRDIPANVKAVVKSVSDYLNTEVPSRDIPANIKSAIQTISDYMNAEVASRDIPANIKAAIEPIISNIKASIKPIVDYMNEIVPSRDVPANIKSAMQSVSNYFNAEVPSRDIPNSIKTAMQSVIDYFRDIPSNIKTAILSIRDDFRLAEQTNSLYKTVIDVNSKIDSLNRELNDITSSQVDIDNAKISLNIGIDKLKVISPDMSSKLTDLQGQVTDIRKPLVIKSTNRLVTQLITQFTSDEQANAIKQLLNANNRVKFDANLAVADLVPDKTPLKLINPTIDFTQTIEALKDNPKVAAGFKAFLQKYPDDVVLGGGAGRVQQLLGIGDKTHDLDIYVSKDSRYTPEQIATMAGDTVKQYSPNSNISVNGSNISVDGMGTDIHVRGYSGINPYGMASGMTPIKIDGVSVVPLKELLSDLVKTATVPAIDESAGLMGAEAPSPFNAKEPIAGTSFATYELRIKDMARIQTVGNAIADALNETDPETARLIRNNLSTIQNTNNGQPIDFSQVYWKGLKIGDTPIIGVSKGHLTVGTSGIEPPTISRWDITQDLEGKVSKTGFKYPESGIATKIIMTKDMLIKLGIPADEADNILMRADSTIGNVKRIPSGKIVSPQELTKGIETLDVDGVKAVQKVMVENKGIIQKAFGSFTIPAYLKEGEILGWLKLRGKLPGDIDIMLNTSDPEVAAQFAKDVMERINSESSLKVSVDSGKPTHLVSNIDGSSVSAVDIHFIGEEGESSNINNMAYGLRISQTPKTVNIEGVGKFDIASLSETARGKMASILEWRQDPTTGEYVVQAANYRLKDYADLYTFIRKQSGQIAADKWANIVDFDIGQKGITVQSVANKIMADIQLTKAEDDFGRMNADAVSQKVADMLRDSSNYKISFSPASDSSIDTSINASSKILPLSASAAISEVLSNAESSRSNVLSDYQSPSIYSVRSSGKYSSSLSPIVSELNYILTSPRLSSIKSSAAQSSVSNKNSSGAVSKSVVSQSSQSPSVSSKSPSISSVKSSPSISPKTSSILPSPSPSSSSSSSSSSSGGSSKSDGGGLGGILISRSGQTPAEQKRKAFEDSLYWQQGFGFWALKEPYSRKQDIAFFKEPPRGGIRMKGAGAAYKTIQQLTGRPPARELLIPLGIMTIKIKSPEYKAGKSGAISYKMNRAAKKGRKTGMVRIVT